jgi:hypothetical protein
MMRTAAFPSGAALLVALSLSSGCTVSDATSPGDDASMDTGADAGADGDTDIDGDVDTDADSDSDSDSDSDTGIDSASDTATSDLDGGAGEDCAHAIEVVTEDGGTAVYTGAWEDYGDDFNSTDPSCNSIANKPDLFLHTVVQPGNRLLVEETGFINSSINLLESCTAQTCLASSPAGGPDRVSYVNGTNKAKSIYVSAGTRWAVKGDFEIDVTNAPVPPGASCELPIAVPPDDTPWTTNDLDWGEYLDNFTADTLTCPVSSYPTPTLGTDIWFSVEVPAQNILGVVNNDFVTYTQAHVLHVVGECGVSTCLDTADGYYAGTVTYANDTDAPVTVYVIVQQTNSIATPPNLTFALRPIPAGSTCKTAFEVAADDLPYAKAANWYTFLDTGGSTGTSCSPYSVYSGGEDVWFKVTVPKDVALYALEDGVLSSSYYDANLTLHDDCDDSTCLSYGSGALTWSSDVSGERTVYLHAERTDTTMGNNLHMNLSTIEVGEGAACGNPLVVDSLPWVKDFPTGIELYLDDMDFTDATCANTSTSGTEIVFERDMLKDETVKLGLGGLSYSSYFQIMVQKTCGADKQCSASTTVGAVSYTATEDGPVYFIVEDLYDYGYSFFVTFWEP